MTMVVGIRAGVADEPVGRHEFDHMPRVGEHVTILWPADPDGVRIFRVVEINHVAGGVSGTVWGDGPVTGLRVEEIG